MLNALADFSEHLPVVTDYQILQFLVGDYNGDGLVEQGDLDLVLLNWGHTNVPNAWIADLPTGAVDQSELDGVLLNWGQTDLLHASVPEPSTLLLAVALILVTYWKQS